MTPKSKKTKTPAVMSEKEYKARLKRIDASLKRIAANSEETRRLQKEMAPDLEALRRFVEDE
jgi:hypothetical protein